MHYIIPPSASASETAIESANGRYKRIKDPHPVRCGSLVDRWSLALSLHAGEAIAAVNRAIGLRLERDTRLAAAGSTGSGVVLSGAAGCVLAGVTAGLAALRLILEATLCVEFLLTGGENELLATCLLYTSDAADE